MGSITTPSSPDFAQFAEEFLSIYRGRGFGSMNKNELEVLIFHLLKKYGLLSGTTNFQLALELHLPESKIKRLAYEAELSYGGVDKTGLRERFFALMEKAKIQKENGTLRFVVEDRFLRSTIYEDLKQMGYYLDSSFNSEIVSIQKDALIALLDLYYEEDKKAEMLKAYKDARKKAGKADGEGLDFKRMMNVVIDKLLERGVDAAVDGAKKVDFESLIKTISTGFKAVKSIIGIIATIAAMA